MDAGPFLGPRYEALLTPLSEEILQPSNLGSLFLADEDSLVPSCEDLVLPAR
jgi:hypothetical protein